MLQTNVGYVYAVHSVDKNLIKIGYSKSPEVRINALRYAWGAPLPLTIVGVVKVKHARLTEKALHWKFAQAREQGEWFRLHPAELMGLMDEGRLEDLTDEFLLFHPDVAESEAKKVASSKSNRRLEFEMSRTTSAKLGAKLSQKIKDSGLSIADVSRKTRINRDLLSKIMRGETEGPRVTTLVKLSVALDYPIDEMVDEEKTLARKDLGGLF